MLQATLLQKSGWFFVGLDGNVALSLEVLLGLQLEFRGLETARELEVLIEAPDQPGDP